MNEKITFLGQNEFLGSGFSYLFQVLWRVDKKALSNANKQIVVIKQRQKSNWFKIAGIKWGLLLEEYTSRHLQPGTIAQSGNAQVVGPHAPTGLFSLIRGFWRNLAEVIIFSSILFLSALTPEIFYNCSLNLLETFWRLHSLNPEPFNQKSTNV